MTQRGPDAVCTAWSYSAAPAPAERYGVPTSAELRGLGRSEAAIDALAAKEAVSEACSRDIFAELNFG